MPKVLVKLRRKKARVVLRRKQPSRALALNRNPRMGRPRGMTGGPLPRLFKTKLHWATTKTITATTNILVGNQFRINSLAEPDITSPIDAHLPRGFNQIAGFYTRYRVYGCKLECECFIVPTGLVDFRETALIGVELHPNDIVGPTSVNDALEQRSVKTRVISSETGTHKISVYATTAFAAGATKEQVRNDNEFAAIISATPPRAPRISFFIGSPHGSVISPVPVQVNVVFKLTYYCQFEGLKHLAQST